MVTVSVTAKAIVLDLNARERALFGRPSLSIDLNRVTGVALEPLPSRGSLGVRVTGRPLFGSLVGEWRLGSSRVLVLKGKTGVQALKISLKHPTIDQIWYRGADAEQLAQILTKNTAK